MLEKISEKENLELVGCTFHPKILQSPQSEKGRGNTSNNSRSNKNSYVNLNNTSQVVNPVNNSQTFDINNLAFNVANEYLKRQSYNSSLNNQPQNNARANFNTIAYGADIAQNKDLYNLGYAN